MKIHSLLVFLIVLSGCAAPAPAQVSPGVYLLSRTSAAGSVFANMAKLKAGVIEDANKFASSKGKIAVPVNMREERPVPGFPLVEYQFKLVDAGAAEADSKTLELSPDTVTQSTENINIKVNKPVSNDVYSELLKLDDLRKQGILTEDEFNHQKQKLLSQH